MWKIQQSVYSRFFNNINDHGVEDRGICIRCSDQIITKCTYHIQKIINEVYQEYINLILNEEYVDKYILKNHFKNYIDDIYENWADLTINIDYGTRFEPRSLNYQIDKPCLSLIIQEYLFEIEEFNLL